MSCLETTLTVKDMAVRLQLGVPGSASVRLLAAMSKTPPQIRADVALTHDFEEEQSPDGGFDLFIPGSISGRSWRVELKTADWR